ncbi:hypothetical protein [Inhella proteolytica]|uniref:Uncharacterized protein n=1 Tax=Inhella proteolytica TaxID=2795029 RepID=A0A931JAA7_9BURK|nr:hypothetical protein [Inhella proteolytica]MBH9579292.1 hypothetical protein [Inhella proteolytica]
MKAELQQALRGLRIELLLLGLALALGLLLLPQLGAGARAAVLLSALLLAYLALRLGLDAWVLRRWLRAPDLPQAMQAFDQRLARLRLRPASGRNLAERLQGLARWRLRALCALALHCALLGLFFGSA